MNTNSTPDPIILSFAGHTPEIDPSAYIAPGACVIGDVTIEADASIWFGCVVRGDDNYIKIGPRTNVQDGTIIHVMYETHPTIIGADVVIGHGARLHGCVLEDNCMVGIGAILLDGAVVETGAIVAAGAFVPPNRRIPAGEIWAGNPAKKLRTVRSNEHEFMAWDVEHYVQLAKRYQP